MLLYFHVPSCALFFLVILLRFDVNSPPEHSLPKPLQYLCHPPRFLFQTPQR